MSDFAPAVEILLSHEGGWGDDAADPGGETNYGISLKAIVPAFHLTPEQLGLPNFEPGCMKLLTRERAIWVYRTCFWYGFHLDQLVDQGSATKMLDARVNLFYATSCYRLAQRASGAVPDGKWGPLTRAAINAMGTGFELAMAERLRGHYEAIVELDPSKAKFLKFWLPRAACVSTNRCTLHRRKHDPQT